MRVSHQSDEVPAAELDRTIWYTKRSNTHGLAFNRTGQTVLLTPWGANAFRVQASPNGEISSEPWALSEPIDKSSLPTTTIRDDGTATIQNGNLAIEINSMGKLEFYNRASGKMVLEEYVRTRDMAQKSDPKCSALKISAREFVPKNGTQSFHLTARFECLDESEKIFGMGQYQHQFLDLKGVDLELAQRNSQASVPFAVSSLGFGFLWNNPGIGRAVFAKSHTTFEAYSTTGLDYWVVVGNTPREIVRAYMKVTGLPPMMPEFGLGFWQCKLRYQTQAELLGVAREHKKRGLPMDVIVCDYFHWEKEGEWKFDPTFFPDPDAMIKELQSLGIELMVSIWPTVQRTSENYNYMSQNSLLIKQDRGWPLAIQGPGNTVHFDATNPKAGDFVWQRAKKHYWDKGIRLFWLDEAEPEYTLYDWDNYRYHRGPQLMIGNVYPKDYSKGFYEGMVRALKEENRDAAGVVHKTSTSDAPSHRHALPAVVNLVRCAWAGSAKYGALLWSGDIASSWISFRDQLQAALNVGIAGIPWFTTDIGGFHGGDPTKEWFRELLVRWFQWGTFCPVMRLHGDRIPKQPRLGTTGGSFCLSGAPNEVWSCGEEVYQICKEYLELRERLRDYVRDLMRETSTHGDPIMRTMFYEFPEDKECWSITDQYMFGSKYLVAPVLYPGLKRREVYLPRGTKGWRQFTSKGQTGDIKQGGVFATVDCPIEVIPVFERVD